MDLRKTTLRVKFPYFSATLSRPQIELAKEQLFWVPPTSWPDLENELRINYVLLWLSYHILTLENCEIVEQWMAPQCATLLGALVFRAQESFTLSQEVMNLHVAAGFAIHDTLDPLVRSGQTTEVAAITKR